jgi:site-specific DNA-methyltransferase (adenine-specific)
VNKLYFGDNLHILREHIKDETVDLIYLDPPFNSKRDYSVLFKTPKGHESDAQITMLESLSRGATEYSQPRVERSGTLG